MPTYKSNKAFVIIYIKEINFIKAKLSQHKISNPIINSIAIYCLIRLAINLLPYF